MTWFKFLEPLRNAKDGLLSKNGNNRRPKSIRIGDCAEIAKETYAFAAHVVDKEFSRFRIQPNVITITALMDLAGCTVPSVAAGAAADASLDDMIPMKSSTNNRDQSTPMDYIASSMFAPFVFPRFGVPPDAYSYTSIISHLGGAGQIHVASDRLDEAKTVPSSRVNLTEGPYAALLGAIARQAEGIIVAECLSQGAGRHASDLA
ncbi:hypothetical protein M427DRAFT_43600 [Gonapodya prolifera JEL478]|uniref:Uncharacterized protein n=1 Tax=Gonapodya prolifera (strain JEL478) TaxID=1344416 RepID=A0A139AI91_GONPJ|nr:hypothetical protein M427DRAFT_43600 [Gonapodya prolifera JEL478]|eukprot:KXS16531.1 hypothetical protein M427DRAFT_43600 [Gonapodya prolifera JEL478]